MSGVDAIKHEIVAERTRHYTCACGEVIQAHPDVLAEAFAFHLGQVIPPGDTPSL